MRISIPGPLRLIRGMLGLSTAVPKLPSLLMLKELKGFILCSSEEPDPINVGIRKALQNGSAELIKYLAPRAKNRPDHIANALHTVCPELHEEIESWISNIFWEQDWEFENRGTKEKLADKKGFFAEVMQRKSVRVLKREIDKSPKDSGSFLEIGFGTGHSLMALADYYPEWEFAGLEQSRLAVENLRTNAECMELSGNLKCFNGTLFRLPFDSGSFDFVYNIGVIEHFSYEQQMSAIREMVRVLKPRGRLLVSVPNSLSPSKIIHMGLNGIYSFDVRSHNAYMLWPFRLEAPMSPFEMKGLYERSGVEVVECCGWYPLRRIYDGGGIFSSSSMGVWDWTNERNQTHPKRWFFPKQGEYSRFALFLRLMSFLGWGVQRGVVDPFDKLTDNKISDYLGYVFLLIGEKT